MRGVVAAGLIICGIAAAPVAAAAQVDPAPAPLVDQQVAVPPTALARDSTAWARVWRGAWKGAAIGGALGFIGGYLSCARGCTGTYGQWDTAILLGLSGVLVGAPLGAFISWEMGRPGRSEDETRELRIGVRGTVRY